MDVKPSPEARLMQAVVVQAFVDATNEVPSLRQDVRRKPGEALDKYEARRIRTLANRKNAYANLIRQRDDARSWLTGGGMGFRRVCEWAGFEPSYIRMKAQKLNLNGWPQYRQRNSETAQAA
jgi:hypothetical protein